MLSFLSNLYYFSYTNWTYQDLQILSILPKSKLRVLSIPIIDSDSRSIFNDITSLTISRCYLNELFKYSSMLKYLKIDWLVGQIYMNDLPNLPIEKALYLKQFIVNNCMQNFKDVELLLKRIPNLTNLTIKAADEIDMISADRWQHLIQSSLSYLCVFNFYFTYARTYSYNDMFTKFQQFQTDFWYKQHHWFTNYEFTSKSALIYTIPYA